MKFHRRMLAVTAVAGALFGFGSAQAGTIIYNTGAAATASVALGVNDDGSLNTSDGNIVVNSGATGLAYNFGTAGWRDATSPGCLCEGWGVQANGVNGGASVENNGGAFNLTFGAATGVTGSTVTTMSTLTSLSQVSIKHEFAPADAAPGALFKVNVTITNTGDTALAGVRYVRAMDWDVPLTEFNEYVTIKGTGTTTLLEQSNDNGFCWSTRKPAARSCWRQMKFTDAARPTTVRTSSSTSAIWLVVRATTSRSSTAPPAPSVRRLPPSPLRVSSCIRWVSRMVER